MAIPRVFLEFVADKNFGTVFPKAHQTAQLMHSYNI